MGDFYDLAVRRKAEVEILRLNLHTAETELARLREELVDAEHEIRALHDELDSAVQERDDLESELAQLLSSPVALPVPAGDDNPAPPILQQRGTSMTWPVHDG